MAIQSGQGTGAPKPREVATTTKESTCQGQLGPSLEQGQESRTVWLSFPEFWGETRHRPIYPTTRKTKNLSNQFPMLWPSPGPQLFTRLA